MSSSTSEEIDWNLFPVTRVFCLVCTAGVVFLFSFKALRFTGDGDLSVTVLADFVSTEGFLTSSESGVLSCIQKSGVWHSMDRFRIVVARTALAYDVGADEEDDDAVTRRLALPYGRDFSVFTRWISFSRVQTGQVFDDELCSPLQFTQQRVSESH